MNVIKNNYEEWTKEDLKTLKRLLQTELTYKKIAFVLNRTKGSVKAIAHKNGWIKYRPENIEDAKPPEDWNKYVSYTHFVKNRRKWDVSNRILYGILLARDVTIKQFANIIDVSPRTVQRWIYEGSKPRKENVEKICEVLKISENILFGGVAYRKSIELTK